jgi:Icc-related predicted phosphoesterase
LTSCFFVSDLHGSLDSYEKLFAAICSERPDAVFLGGDILPSGLVLDTSVEGVHEDFVGGYLAGELGEVRETLGERYPRVFLILGNDDPRFEEAAVRSVASEGIWEYVHDRRATLGQYLVYGYAHVPPTPFRLKDWERYDVSRYVDPGCVSPEEGGRTVPVSESEARYATIKGELDRLVGEDDLSSAIMLFHSPPYQTNLDRAALDGKMIDHVQLDVNVGSIAIRRLIEARQPLVTLHGHVHESARITGSWRGRIGRTHLFSAAHDGPELAIVRFSPEDPGAATRDLI